jgi:putative ABC transport system substrate-binding protein
MFCIPRVVAQQPAIPRVGVISVPPNEELLRAALRERGYVEGRTISIDWRSRYTSDEELKAIATQLVHSQVDVIVTFGTPAARAALSASATIPVIFSAGDPVGTDLAESLVRPGRNGTGVSVVATDLSAKRLDLLHQLAPHARRIAYLMNSSNPLGALQLEQARIAAETLNLEIIVLDARNRSQLETRLHGLHAQSAYAVLVTADLLFQLHRATIASAIRRAKLPAIVPYKAYLDDGTLSSYGPNLKELSSRIAAYVDRISKGAKPSDLPIEQVSTYELVIDLRSARMLGINVPSDLLYRADEVIQ